MVRIGSPSNLGPDYTSRAYSRSYTPYKPEPYKPTRSQDYVKHQTNKPSEYSYKPTGQRYDYKEYKPTSVGIYGENARQKVQRTKGPSPPVHRQIRQPRRTFDCYSLPKGPDIRVSETGPEHKVKEFKPKDYKPSSAINDRPRTAKDTLKHNAGYIDKPVAKYETVEYKLDETNNAGMRHWHHDFIDDTVSAYRTDGREQKYKVDKKPKPEVKKKEEPKKKPEKKKEKAKTEEKPKKEPEVAKKAVVAAATMPVRRPISPPKPKTYASSTTQTQENKLKTSQTQYEPVKTKTLATQYETLKTQSSSVQTSPHPTPVPAVAPLVYSQAPKKAKTKSEGVQVSEQTKKLIGQGTQSDGPQTRAINTQTSPLPVAPAMVPIPAHRHSPVYAEEVHQQSPVYRKASERRSSSPKVHTVVYEKHNLEHNKEPVITRSITESRWTPSPETGQSRPEVHSTAPPMSTMRDDSTTVISQARRDSPRAHLARGLTPRPNTPQISPTRRESPRAYLARELTPRAKTTQNMKGQHLSSGYRLPPEVTACIEAYNNAHGSRRR